MDELVFEWDELKNEANLAKHGIDFHRAALIFKSAIVERVDDREEYGEQRSVALGVVGLDVYRVVHTEGAGQAIRIISAQKAGTHEREIYYRSLDARRD